MVLGLLVSVVDSAFADANGNSQRDPGEDYRTYTYTLTGARETEEREIGGERVLNRYKWDAEDRLSGIEGGTVTTGEQYEYAYTYDYRTRRVVRDESRAGGERTRLTYVGGTSFAEYAGENTTPEVYFVRGSDYGGGVGGILYSVRDQDPSYAHFNSRGDVIARTDATGTITYLAGYEAFGRHGDTASSSEWGTNPDRQQANTKEEDPTGLLNEGFRYRDLETGTFLTRDPLGFVDGPNLYAYVVQNPWTMFDPKGLATVKEYEDSAAELERRAADAEKQAETLNRDDYDSDDAFETARTELVESARMYREHADRNLDAAERSREAWAAAYLTTALTAMLTGEKQSLVDVDYFDDRDPANAAFFELSARTGDVNDLALAYGLTNVAGSLTTKVLERLSRVGSTSGSQYVTVSRWGSQGVNAGDWVMKGGKTPWNYFWSGKWQPGAGNQFAAPWAGSSARVPQSTIRSPMKGDVGTKYETSATLKIKKWLGQRIYDP